MKKFPHTWVIVFALIILSAVLTWLIPGGEYTEVQTAQGKTLVYKQLENQPQTWQVFSAFYKGFTKQSGIIIFILLIGGAFWILTQSKAIEVGILSFLRLSRKAERFSLFRRLGINNIIIIMVMLVFSLFGAVFGMSEETIVFVIILVPLAISMGYDSIVGVCMVYIAAHVGFAGAIFNPFTIGIAQGIAGIPLFSGFEYRLLCWIILNIITITWVLWYAKRVLKHPERSPVYSEDAYWRSHSESQNTVIEYKTYKTTWLVFALIQTVLILFSLKYPSTTLSIGNPEAHTSLKFTFPALPILTALFALTSLWLIRKSYHFFILNLLFFTIFFLIIGVMGYQWYIMEIASLFLALGILSGIAMNESANRIVKMFIEGAGDILSAALVVGLAGGIIVILEDGKVIASILHYLSSFMAETGKLTSLSIMYLIQTFINIIIPSGSAKAALTMPIMAPFSDLIGISRQATVLAFQFGDGFTNMITPTSGVLIGVLGIARIPYYKWFRWILPFMIILILTGFLLLIPTVLMQLPGF